MACDHCTAQSLCEHTLRRAACVVYTGVIMIYCKSQICCCRQEHLHTPLKRLGRSARPGPAGSPFGSWPGWRRGTAARLSMRPPQAMTQTPSWRMTHPPCPLCESASLQHSREPQLAQALQPLAIITLCNLTPLLHGTFGVRCTTDQRHRGPGYHCVLGQHGQAKDRQSKHIALSLWHTSIRDCGTSYNARHLLIGAVPCHEAHETPSACRSLQGNMWRSTVCHRCAA